MGAEFFFEKSEELILSSTVTLEIDGKQTKLPDVKGLIILNLPSCYGGKNLWGVLSAQEAFSIFIEALTVVDF